MKNLRENKDLILKIIPSVLLMSIVLFLFLFGEKTGFSVMAFQNKAKVEVKVEEIINANADKELMENKTIQNRFVYLFFQKDEEMCTFFVDKETGEEENFTHYLKKGSENAFTTKVDELLELKYPKFIVDVLKEEELHKTYQVMDTMLVIFYDTKEVLPDLTERVSLQVDYNEIKDYLDFSVTVSDEYENENGYTLDKNKKAIALTFDDGPSGSLTNRLVEILEQNKAHATFFMVGNRMESGASVIRNVINKGNEIGSHSYAHKNMKRQKIEDIVSGEEQTKEIYKNITGQDLIYTRPPYGNVNANIKQALDTIFITWNVDTEDWLHRDKDYIVNHIMEHASDGDIILMHDIYESTIDAVEEVLPKLYAAGYQVVTISELAELKGITLEQHSLYRSLKEVQ